MNQREHRPYVIGITGTIGSGKSGVGAVLKEMNIPVIDTDVVVHDLFSNDDALKTAIRSRFGNDTILTRDGSEIVDRQALGKIVFADASARKDLEGIVHPATIEETQRRIEHSGVSDLVAVLVPLLFEAGLEKHYDEIWAIYTDEKTLRTRLSARDNLNEEEVEKRLAAQLPQKEKVSRSDETINNSGTIEQTKQQVVSLIEKVRKKLHEQLSERAD